MYIYNGACKTGVRESTKKYFAKFRVDFQMTCMSYFFLQIVSSILHKFSQNFLLCLRNITKFGLVSLVRVHNDTLVHLVVIEVLTVLTRFLLNLDIFM